MLVMIPKSVGDDDDDESCVVLMRREEDATGARVVELRGGRVKVRVHTPGRLHSHNGLITSLCITRTFTRHRYAKDTAIDAERH
jgi:hypothetical protein